jgi:hypothetical protein
MSTFGYYKLHLVGLQVKDALQMYEDLVGSVFKFIYCWFILRNENKWTQADLFHGLP